MKILIAEDDNTARFLLVKILEKEGYSVIEARDGEEAWQIYSDNEDLAFCILDWMIPKKDGVSLCKKIRESEKNSEKYSYILMLTAKSQMEDLISAMKAGADDYMKKPFKKAELLARIKAGKRILDLKKQIFDSREEALFYSSVMAHDLQNYNFGAMGYIEMVMMNPIIPEENKKLLQTAYDFVKKNMELIDSVRKIMKSKHNKRNLEKIDLAEIFEIVTNEVTSIYSDRPLEIRSNIRPNEYIVLGDEFIKDLFQNLITNAVKYDGHENVVIDIEVENESNFDNGFITVQIKDNGCGIPDDKKETIFNRCERNSSRNGTGLGLTIAKAITDRYRGRIWVEDRVNGDFSQGSIFNVILGLAERDNFTS